MHYATDLPKTSEMKSELSDIKQTYHLAVENIEKYAEHGHCLTHIYNEAKTEFMATVFALNLILDIITSAEG